MKVTERQCRHVIPKIGSNPVSPRDEQLIEQFVRGPEQLSEERRQSVERLIDEDPGAQAYAEFLRGFYRRLEAGPTTSPSGRVEAFVEGLFSENENTVVPLRPFQSRQESRPTVLAAETRTTDPHVSSDERRFSVLTTLEAETESLLVRVLGDRKTGQGCLYVLAEPAEQRAHVVVSFPDLGLNLIADEEGRRAFDVPPGITPQDWADTQAVVRRPLATRTIGPEEDMTLALPGGETLLGKRTGKTLRVVLESHGSDAPSRFTITAPDQPARLFRLGNAPSEWEVPSEAALTLRVYE